MSREASTSERTEEIINDLISPNIRAEVFLEVESNGSFTQIDDIDFEAGIKWTEAGKKDNFSKFPLTPLPGTVTFRVLNTNGKYFDGSGTAFENLFDLETRVKLKAGYILESGSAATNSINLNDIAGLFFVKSFFFRTEHSGGTVIIDPDGTGTATHFADAFNPLYDSETYDDSTYTPDAYTVQTYDSNVAGFETFTKFTITANNTDGTVLWRTFDDPEILDNSFLSEWNNAGATVNGTKTVDFTDIDCERFIQIAVLYDGITWSGGQIISDITVSIISRFEQLYTSVYYLDRPSFTDPKTPTQPVINCTGRDIFKRAIGIDIKYSDVGGLEIDAIIKLIADKVGIRYNSTSIADLTSFAARVTFTVGNTDVVKADKLLDQCMQIINTTGYVMFTEYDSVIDDNILFVQLRPALADTTGVFSFKNYENIGATAKNPVKILQRMTIFTDSQSTNDEVQLDTEAFTTTGAKSLTWTGNAEYKRLIVDEPDNITISSLSVNPTNITFTIDSISGTVNITVFGSKFSTAPPAFEGEAMDFVNMSKLDGVTSKVINPLVISDAEAKSISESFVSQFGTPVFEAKGLMWPYLNLIPELNDGFMLWRRFVGGTSADDIYIITKATHHFDKNDNPNHWTQWNLEDSGSDYSDLGAFTYDSIMDWDRGFIWDMGISTPLSTDAEIDAATTITHNTGF